MTLSSGRLGRRPFLRGLGAAVALPVIGSGCGESGPDGMSGTTWLSAQGSEDEELGLVAVPDPFEAASKIATGFRGHDVAQHPTRSWEAALFGRRPGTKSAVIDLAAARVDTVLEAPSGRAFQGHGFFTPDGRYLVTSEADTTTAEGFLGVWDGASYARLDELQTFGIGPHEVQLMPDGVTIVVANGGLLTRPETGREVLNLDTMDSSLVHLDLETGALLEQRRLVDSKSSIRHIDVLSDGLVVFGVQVQREALDHDGLVPLAGTHRRGQEMRYFEGGESHMALLNDYVGSVAASDEARVAGFTSPRGDVALFWDLESGAHVGAHALADCSGIATTPEDDRFVLSSSFGEVRTLHAADLAEVPSARRRFDDVRWDNHLIAVRV